MVLAALRACVSANLLNLFANLDKIDHYIKERLGVKYYIRYMDDFILIHNDRKFLEKCLEIIRAKLLSQKMHVNDAKTKITELKDGIRFLGFVFRISNSGKAYALIDPKKIKREKRKIRRMISLMRKGELKRKDIDIHFRSFKSFARYGSSRKLIQNLNRWYNAEMQKEQKCL